MRTYSKDSFIAKIVRWYYGYLPSSNTCDVRKIVLFLAPWKLITNPRVFGRDWPIGLVWAQVLVIWVALFSGWNEDVVPTFLLRGLCVAVLLFEVAALATAIFSGLTKPFRRTVENAFDDIFYSDTADNVRNFIADTWGSIYNKVCKKVEWK